MPEWRSWKVRRVESRANDGTATSVQWEAQGRVFKFNIDRTAVVVTGLVIAEVAS